MGTVNQLNDGTLTTTRLLHCADVAMYNSKSLGRNRISLIKQKQKLYRKYYDASAFRCKLALLNGETSKVVMN